ncbi:hypothetical protein PMAYCL1PPCAC_16751, partial [Pristionchus mayeri]
FAAIYMLVKLPVLGIFILYDCFCAFFSNIARIGCCKYKRVDGQVILITGAGGGLGRLLALRLADRGATLVLWDADEKGLKNTQEQCVKEANGVVKIYVVDMLDRSSIARAAEAVKKEVGPVNILINNAAIGISGKLMEMAEENIRKIVDVNMMAHFWTAREFLPDMLAKDSGHIVTIASLGGLFVSAEDMIPYCVSKYGALAIQEGLENECESMKKNGVKFTTVCPGYFHSQLQDNPIVVPHLGALSADYVADSAIDAILREMRIRLIPRYLYIAYMLKGILPRRSVSRIIVGLFGPDSPVIA